MKHTKHTKYHVQRVIIRALERAQDELILASNALELLALKHPDGLEGGWTAHDLEQMKFRFDDALKETGDIFYHLS
jgi:hypothetical protein